MISGITRTLGRLKIAGEKRFKEYNQDFESGELQIKYGWELKK
jgi:hypothetical protein